MTYNLSHIVKSLNGRMLTSTSGICCCPAHDDKNPSLSLAMKNGKLLWHCHAGCVPDNVIATLKSMELLENSSNSDYQKSSYSAAKVAKSAKENKNLDYAKQLWNESKPAENTHVETYLRERGYIGDIPPSVRYNQKLKHSKSEAFFPAMVAQVVDKDGKLIAIHRTYLAADGKRKALVESPKMMLGNVAGGAVMFGKFGRKLIVAEGIETALSVYQATGVPTWATLSTSGMTKVILPPVDIVPELIVAADCDSNNAGIKAANILADRETAKGRKVSIALPPKGDFNDLLMEGTLCL